MLLDGFLDVPCVIQGRNKGGERGSFARRASSQNSINHSQKDRIFLIFPGRHESSLRP